jgi:hypothetical protein
MIIRVARLGHLPFAPLFAALAACAGAKPEPPPRASGAEVPLEWLRVKDLKREYRGSTPPLTSLGTVLGCPHRQWKRLPLFSMTDRSHRLRVDGLHVDQPQ